MYAEQEVTGKIHLIFPHLATFVLAGAGVKVAKHGNYGVTSACGSSNIMEHFGYKFSTDNDKLRREIEKTGFAFCMHPCLIRQ